MVSFEPLLLCGLLLGLLQWTYGAGGELTCYDCHSDHFPDCLNKPSHCHHDEVCEFVYNSNAVTIACKKTHDCTHGHHDDSCGGFSTHHGCAVCCEREECVSQHLSTLMGAQLATSPDPLHMGCPDSCHHVDVSLCLMSAQSCSPDEFCHLTIDTHGLKGKCSKLHDKPHCSLETLTHSTQVCEHGDVSLMAKQDHCTFCCTDTTCRVMSFLNPGSVQTSTVQTVTSQQLSTTTLGAPLPSTTAGHSLLNGTCEDKSTDCGTQKVVQCKSDSGIRTCAKTCGLCSLIQSTFSGHLCEDQLLNNECDLLKTTKNICNNTIAKFTCPKTCNICDDILDGLVSQILNSGGSSSPSATQAVTMTTTADTCVDTIKDMSCTSLTNVCNNTLAPFLCRKFCGLCGSTSIP